MQIGKEYHIAAGESIAALEEAVRHLIGLGYVPQGGVSFANSMFHQAMVKKELAGR